MESGDVVSCWRVRRRKIWLSSIEQEGTVWCQTSLSVFPSVFLSELCLYLFLLVFQQDSTRPLSNKHTELTEKTRCHGNITIAIWKTSYSSQELNGYKLWQREFDKANSDDQLSTVRLKTTKACCGELFDGERQRADRIFRRHLGNPIFWCAKNKVQVRQIFGQPGNPNLATHLVTANKKATCETIWAVWKKQCWKCYYNIKIASGTTDPGYWV